jgi:hypothetical protein
MAKDKLYYTPAGTAVFPHITEADTRGDFADKKFKTSLALSEADLKKVKADVAAWAKTQKFKVKEPKFPFKIVKGKDGAEDREVLFAKQAWRPLVYDAKNLKLPDSALDNMRVGGGSTIRLGVEFYNYDKGVSLRLRAVQIIELVQGGGGEADFGEAEGGYSFEDNNEGGFGGSASDDENGPDI